MILTQYLFHFKSNLPVLVLLHMFFLPNYTICTNLYTVLSQMDNEQHRDQWDWLVSWPTLPDEAYLQTEFLLRLAQTRQTSTVFSEHSSRDALWRMHPGFFFNRHSFPAWCRPQPRDINEWWQNVSCGNDECIACRHNAYGASPVLRASRALVSEQCQRSGPHTVRNCTMNSINITSTWVSKGLNSLILLFVLLSCQSVFKSEVSLCAGFGYF